jgi:hypothetical protein
MNRLCDFDGVSGIFYKYKQEVRKSSARREHMHSEADKVERNLEEIP